MSPAWSTRSTAGSALISATRLGNSASLTSPYGVSPITAIVKGRSSGPRSALSPGSDGVGEPFEHPARPSLRAAYLKQSAGALRRAVSFAVEGAELLAGLF